MINILYLKFKFVILFKIKLVIHFIINFIFKLYIIKLLNPILKLFYLNFLFQIKGYYNLKVQFFLFLINLILIFDILHLNQ